MEDKIMQTTRSIKLDIAKNKEGTYFELPFEVPEDVARIDIRYSYPRFLEIGNGSAVEAVEGNIVDIGLKNADGEFVGFSGSERTHIWISEYHSCPGYAQTETKKGEWAVIVGAYKIMNCGVTVDYELTFTTKERTLIKGDLHTHSLCSDGKLTVNELIDIAKKSGLQFLFITDHNNYFHNDALKSDDELTVIPGVEWTHYKGHVNLLGIKKPFDGPFYTNTIDETRKKLSWAHDHGAIVSINHPFCPKCGFKWGLENVTYDCIEVWNGPMKQAELDCLAWWHEELCRGRKIPVVGGSDFHRYEFGRGIGMPATWLYSLSRTPSDICAAVREGCSFITYTADGPTVYLECAGKILGQTVPYQPGLEITLEFSGLRRGDIVKIITNTKTEEVICDADIRKVTYVRQIENALFYRVEVHRIYTDGMTCAPVMVSNPVYIGY
jgi:hypothetical protein